MSCNNCDKSNFSIGPTKTSKKIAQLRREGADFSKSSLFNLKEYIPLTRDGSEVLPKILIDLNSLYILYNNANDNINISIPGPNGVILNLFLTKV